jgi:hypothetical protein
MYSFYLQLVFSFLIIMFSWFVLILRSVEPLAIEPKLPKDVSVGDTVLSPLVIMNNSSADLTDVSAEALVCGESGMFSQSIDLTR